MVNARRRSAHRAVARSARPAERQGGGKPRHARAEWRIVSYVDGDVGETRFAIFRGGRRLAWGLSDRADAERWLIRSGVPLQQPLPLGGTDGA